MGGKGCAPRRWPKRKGLMVIPHVCRCCGVCTATGGIGFPCPLSSGELQSPYSIGHIITAQRASTAVGGTAGASWRSCGMVPWGCTAGRRDTWGQGARCHFPSPSAWSRPMWGRIRETPDLLSSPPSPLPLLERKEELKMKLKHNSIRSGSRIKSSALIVHWQALPARQQTQCYQGTEGRFVCTGRESCCVRPACPEPGEHRDTRMGPRAAEGSSTPTPSLWVPLDGAAASGPSWWISSAAEGQHSGVMLDDENTRVPVSRVFPGAGAPRGVAQPPALHFAVSHRAGRAGCPMLSPYASPWTASRIPHPTLISARALAVPSVPGLPAGLLWGQHSLLSLSLYTPVIFNSAYANPKSGMSSGPGPRGNGHGANFLPFLPLFLYNTQQRFSSAA